MTSYPIGLTDSIVTMQHYNEGNDAPDSQQYTAFVQAWKVPIEAEPGTIIVEPEDLPALAEAVLMAIQWWGLHSIQADKIEHDGRIYFLALCNVTEEGDRFVVRHEGGWFDLIANSLTAEVRAVLKQHCKRLQAQLEPLIPSPLQ